MSSGSCGRQLTSLLWTCVDTDRSVPPTVSTQRDSGCVVGSTTTDTAL